MGKKVKITEKVPDQQIFHKQNGYRWKFIDGKSKKKSPDLQILGWWMVPWLLKWYMGIVRILYWWEESGNVVKFRIPELGFMGVNKYLWIGTSVWKIVFENMNVDKKYL